MTQKNPMMTLHVGGTALSTPSDGVMTLLRDLQLRHSAGKDDMQEGITQQQQQILQLQNQLRLLQGQPLPPGVQVNLTNLLKLPTKPVGVAMPDPQEQLRQQQLQQQQVQFQQLRLLQGLQQQEIVGQQQQLQQLLLQQLQRPMTAPIVQPLQDLQYQQLLQMQKRQQQQQQQQQMQLQRQLLQQQLQQQQQILLQQQQQQQQLQLQLQEQLRRQSLPTPATVPSISVVPRVEVVKAGAAPAMAPDVQQKLQLLQRQFQHAAPPPADSTPDVAKTNLVLSLLHSAKAPEPTAVDTAISQLGPIQDNIVANLDRLHQQKKLEKAQVKPQVSAEGEPANAGKTGLLCSLLGVHGEQPAGTGIPVPAPTHLSAPATASGGVDLSQLLTPPVPGQPSISVGAPPLVTTSAPIPFLGAPAPLSGVNGISGSGLQSLLVPAVMPQAVPATSTSGFPLTLASDVPLVAPGPPISLADLKKITTPEPELAPALKSLQLQQLLLQSGGGPKRFSHVSASSEPEAPQSAPEKGPAEGTLMRIQAGDHGITDFNWLVTLASKKAKDGPPPALTKGLGTWLHAEGKEPLPLMSTPPPKPKAERPKGSRPAASDKKVYSHGLLKDLQYTHDTEATPASIPKELIRDEDDYRRRRSAQEGRRAYDEHDHRNGHDDGSDDEGRGGSRRQRGSGDRGRS